MNNDRLDNDRNPGSHDYDDDNNNNNHEDLNSVQLLMFSGDDGSTSSSSSCTMSETQVMNALKQKMSPATQTLHQLSQTVDQLNLLRPSTQRVNDNSTQRNVDTSNFSQYEFSAAEILATAANTGNDKNTQSSFEREKDDDIMVLREEQEEKKSTSGEVPLPSAKDIAPNESKNARRSKMNDVTRKVVNRKYPSRTNSKSSNRTSTVIKKTGKRPIIKSQPVSKDRPETVSSSMRGSYKSQPVEKWRGSRLVKVYPSMRQAAEAERCHHNHIKMLIDTGTIANGFGWKFQKSIAKKKNTAKKESTSISQNSRAARSTSRTLRQVVKTSPKSKGPTKKKSPVKHSYINRRTKSVQRLNKDGSVSGTFPSMRQASMATGVERHSIRDCLNDANMKDSDGLGWRLMETLNEARAEKTMALKENSPGNKQEEVKRTQRKNSASAPNKEKAKVEKKGRKSTSPVVPNEEKSKDEEKHKGGPPLEVSNEEKPEEEKKEDKEAHLFDVSFVEISDEGKLGLTIRSFEKSEEVREAVCKSTSMRVGAIVKGCVVESVKSEGHCDKAGIRTGDILFLLTENERRTFLSGEYDIILEAAKKGERPIKFCTARPMSSKITPKAAPNVESLKEKQEAESAPIKVCMARPMSSKIIPKAPPNVESWPKKQQEADSTPFCALCNGRGTTKCQVHHAWCPHNPQFQKSGAHEVLRRIKEGIELGCNVCETEFQTGRIQQNLVHTLACRENQKVIFDLEDIPQQFEVKSTSKFKERKSSSCRPVEVATKKRKMNETPLKTKRGRKIKVSSKILTSEANLSDIGRDDSDASGEMESQGKRRPVSSLFRAKRSPVPDKAKNKPSSVQTANAITHSQRAVANALRPNQNISFKDSVASKPTEKPYARFAADYSSDSDAEYDGSGEVEVTWEACPDPWGETGFVDGDVVIFSNQTGVGNVESILPSPRFAFNPLSSSYRYKKTHYTPNEGFHALLLRRDPRRVLSWGFSVHRHEFGGACLVSSVEPMSPAQAAVFVGAHSEDRSRAALRKNDMIMAVDGKEVGGMTEESFKLALELAGSELVLVVSRYKCYSEESEVQERRFLSNVDKHINDQNRLHWADIGASSPSACQNIGKLEETGHIFQKSSPESNESVNFQASPDSTTYQSNQMYISAANQGNNRSMLRADLYVTGEKTDSSPPKKRVEAHDSTQSIKQIQSIDEPQDSSVGHDLEENESTSVISSVAPTDLRSVLEADEESSADEFGEDGNAWCGCVCGKEHRAKGSYFWIQCEACCSWFNVYQKCVGFGKKEAESMEEWTCWACGGGGEEISQESSDQRLANLKRESSVHRKEPISEIVLSDEETESATIEEETSRVHKVGSLVHIQEHAWSGVNNPEGIARVTGVHMDKEDGRTYDVKYIVGHSAKNVFARYVKPHSFD